MWNLVVWNLATLLRLTPLHSLGHWKMRFNLFASCYLIVEIIENQHRCCIGFSTVSFVPHWTGPTCAYDFSDCWVCVCVCVCACICVCLRARACVCACVCVCMHACMNACMCAFYTVHHLSTQELLEVGCMHCYLLHCRCESQKQQYFSYYCKTLTCMCRNHVSTNPPLPVVKIGQCVVHALVILCVCVCVCVCDVWVRACACVVIYIDLVELLSDTLYVWEEFWNVNLLIMRVWSS